VTACSAGTLVPVIAAAKCWGAAGNYNAVSTSTDNSVTVSSAAPSLTMTAPAAGAYWARGTVHNITWDAALLAGNATLQLWDYNGNALTNPNYGTSVELTSSVAANAGAWAWTVPSGQTSGTNYKIRVLALEAQGTPAAYSPGFDIGADTAFVRINGTPLNAGTPVFAPGTSLTVPWLAYQVTGNLDVYLYDYTGTPTGTKLTSAPVPAANGSWNWNIPTDQTIGGMYKLRIYQSTAVGDYSDVYFAIGTGTPSVAMVSPNGGEAWTRGQTHTVTVAANCAAGLLSVYMYNYTTGAGETIAASTVKESPTGTTSFTWTIPAGHVTGTKFKMRVVNGAGTLSDFSNNYFTIN